MKEIYLIIEKVEFKNSEEIQEFPLYAVGDKITAKNDCIRLQDENKQNKWTNKNFEFKKINFYEF